jgi:hypothetical protein
MHRIYLIGPGHRTRPGQASQNGVHVLLGKVAGGRRWCLQVAWCFHELPYRLDRRL